jgi:hypothetical protein
MHDAAASFANAAAGATIKVAAVRAASTMGKRVMTQPEAKMHIETLLRTEPEKLNKKF